MVARLKVRQPLGTLLLPLASTTAQAQLATLVPLIQAEVNVKRLTYATDTAAVVIKKIKPNFKTLGQRYGQYMKALTLAITQMSQEDIKRLEAQTYYKLPAPFLPQEKLPQQAAPAGEHSPHAAHIMLSLADVIITSEDIPGWAVASEDGITVALDITVDEALRQEGLARDLVNRLQNLRKDQGLAVQDKVLLTLATKEPLVQAAIQQHQTYIGHEVQALQLAIVENIAQGTSLDLDGYTVQVQMDVQAQGQEA